MALGTAGAPSSQRAIGAQREDWYMGEDVRGCSAQVELPASIGVEVAFAVSQLKQELADMVVDVVRKELKLHLERGNGGRAGGTKQERHSSQASDVDDKDEAHEESVLPMPTLWQRKLAVCRPTWRQTTKRPTTS